MSDTQFDKKTFSKVAYKGEELKFKDTAKTRNGIFNDLVKSLYVEGMSVEDVASELGITSLDVEKLKKTALRALYTGSTKPETVVERKRNSLDAASFKGRKYTLSA